MLTIVLRTLTVMLSKYHDILSINNNNYLVNTYHPSVIELDDNTLGRLRCFAKTGDAALFSEEEVSLLSKEGFLMSDFEENNRLISIINSYNQGKQADIKNVKIDIAITPFCNFTCNYCFANCGVDSNTSTYGLDYNEFRKRIIVYVSEVLNRGAKEILVVWYGGEPMLEVEKIKDLNTEFISLCLKHDAQYSNIIVTNGYFLTETVVESMCSQNIRYFQITLDGNKDVHNSRRTTRKKEDTFSKIVSGIKLLLDRNFSVCLRINVDTENSYNLLDLLNFSDMNIERKYRKGNFFIDFGRVFFSDKSLSFFDYEKVYKELHFKSVELGFSDSVMPINMLSAFCPAEANSMDLMTDCFGNIYNCWHDIFTDEIISILPDVEDMHNYFNVATKRNYGSVQTH